MAIPFWLTKLLVRTRLAGFTRRARRLTDGGSAYLKYYSDRVLSAPLDELLDSAFVPHAPGPDVLDLNQPTPDAPPARGAISVGRTDALSAPGRLPATLPELRTAIADRYQRDGRTLAADADVFATHGATAAYAAALDAFVNPGDRVVLFDPCSPLFSLGAKSRHAKVRWVPTWTEDGRCRYIAADFERAMRGAKMLVISDPGSPAGGCLANEDLEHIAWIASGYGVLVYLDESFAAFRYGERPRRSPRCPARTGSPSRPGRCRRSTGSPVCASGGWRVRDTSFVRASSPRTSQLPTSRRCVSRSRRACSPTPVPPMRWTASGRSGSTRWTGSARWGWNRSCPEAGTSRGCQSRGWAWTVAPSPSGCSRTPACWSGRDVRSDRAGRGTSA